MISRGNGGPTFDLPGIIGVPYRSDMKHLKAVLSGTNNSGFTSVGSNTPYQVPSGKKLVCVALVSRNQASSSGSGVQFGYNDAAIANNAATSASNPIYAASGSATEFGLAVLPARNSNSAPVEVSDVRGFEIPATKYPFIRGGTGFTITVDLYAYEADA